MMFAHFFIGVVTGFGAMAILATEQYNKGYQDGIEYATWKRKWWKHEQNR